MAGALELIWLAFVWATVIVSGWLLSTYLFSVYTGRKGRIDKVLGPVEGWIYRAAGVDPAKRMTWKEYMASLLTLSLAMGAFAFIVLIGQAYLPLNPQHFPNMRWDLALNTAVSFITNTDLQHYAGETALSYLSQMAAVGTLQFVSAAVGLCVAVAVFRGFSGKYGGVGNFYYDFVRSLTRVLIPLSFAAALLLAALGLPQALGGYITAATVGGGTQTIEVGPVASFVSIMQLGTNGGGYYGANAASPYQNPSPATNWLEMWMMILFVTAMPFLFGRIVGNPREGYMLLIAVYTLYAINVAIAFIETPQLGAGMETRIGAFSSVLWTVTATSTMTGSANASLSAFNPLVILAALMGMFTQAAPGGIGTGAIFLLLYVVVTVFIVGLMAGRTPEYLGAKITPGDIKNAVIGFVSHPLLILVPAALAFSLGAAASVGAGSGAAGFTSVMYEFASAASNNGSSMLGTAANTVFFNLSTAAAMLLGRYIPIAVMLAIAGSMSRRVRATGASLKTDNLLFACILVASILVLVVLTFLPFFMLGPILAALQGLNAI